MIKLKFVIPYKNLNQNVRRQKIRRKVTTVVNKKHFINVA